VNQGTHSNKSSQLEHCLKSLLEGGNGHLGHLKCSLECLCTSANPHNPVGEVSVILVQPHSF
jgi:hypothetical protein